MLTKSIGFVFLSTFFVTTGELYSNTLDFVGLTLHDITVGFLVS